MKAYLIPLFALMLLISSCEKRQETLYIHRYDQALRHVNLHRLSQSLDSLTGFYPFYLEGAPTQDSQALRQMYTFLTDPQVKRWEEELETQYPDEELSRTLSEIFRKVQTFYPDYSYPQVYTYISYLDYFHRVMVQDSVLSISLEFYLNQPAHFYDAFQIPQYLSRRFTPEYLPVDVCRSIAQDLIRRENSQNLLDEMVYQGEILFFITQVLNEKEYRVLSYTPEELSWCRKNEKRIWNYLIEENLLFETEMSKIRNFINDGPGNFPYPQAAPRLGHYIGYRIVSEYVKNIDKPWTEAFDLPSQKILQISKYKP